MSRVLIICCLCLSILACQDQQKSKEDCPLGEPTPVYHIDLDFVESHTFEKIGQNSEEMVRFTDDLRLTIRQSGCKQIRQDYIFVLPSAPESNDQFWIEKSVALFGQLGSYSENFYSFNQWADKISEFKSDFRLTEPFEVAPNIQVKIDRIAAPKETQLIISLLQK